MFPVGPISAKKRGVEVVECEKRFHLLDPMGDVWAEIYPHFSGWVSSGGQQQSSIRTPLVPLLIQFLVVCNGISGSYRIKVLSF